MKTLACASILAAVALAGDPAAAQSSAETVTTQQYAPTAPYVAAPSPYASETTRTTRAVDPSGDRTESRSTTYGDGASVTSTTRTVAPPPPLPPPPLPPPVSTTTTTTRTTVIGPQ